MENAKTTVKFVSRGITVHCPTRNVIQYVLWFWTIFHPWTPRL